MKKGKIETDTTGEFILLTVFLIVVLLIIAPFVFPVGQGGDEEVQSIMDIFTREGSCWFSNFLSFKLFGKFSPSCSPIIIKELKPGSKVEKGEEIESLNKQISSLMTRCWWMYGKGKWDVTATGDLELLGEEDWLHTCYSFSADRKMDLNELTKYMKTHRKGKVKKTIDSDWSYIQIGGKGNTICFDKKLNGAIKKDERYYIKFFDNRVGVDNFLKIFGSFGPLMKEYVGTRDFIFVTDKSNLLYFARSEVECDGAIK